MDCRPRIQDLIVEDVEEEGVTAAVVEAVEAGIPGEAEGEGEGEGEGDGDLVVEDGECIDRWKKSKSSLCRNH